MKIMHPLFLTLICLSITELKLQGVTPPPDGGYPGGNTAEGQGALLSRTTGGYNTAVGFLSLRSDATGSFNTAVGAGTLLANTTDQNTAVGAGALLSNNTGSDNTAVGAFALVNNTTGVHNTATGLQALLNNTTGNENTAFGVDSLALNTVGSFNIAVGFQALFNSTAGANTAVGWAALQNITGDGNTALGYNAGVNNTAGDGNVYIGANVPGVAGESNQTYIRNINTTTVSGGGSDTVTVDLATGLIGHLSSSRRYKQDIEPMANASETVYRLRPVVFHYNKQVDRTHSPAFGLIAEEVAEVNPHLVACNSSGEPESVHYEMVNAMLLNEFLKEHKGLLEERRKVQKLQANAAQQQKQIDALTAGLQKVSAQLELSKSARRTVMNNH